MRLIGKHDAVFLFVIYSLFVWMFNTIDFFATSYSFGLNYWYLVYALYVFGKLMDSKRIGNLRYASFVSIIIYCLVYGFTLKNQINLFPNRSYPLFSIQNDTMTNATETAIG